MGRNKGGKILCLVWLAVQLMILSGVGIWIYQTKQSDIVLEELEVKHKEGTDDLYLAAKAEALEAGVYELSINYETDADDVYVCIATDMPSNCLYADDFTLSRNKDRLNTQIWLNKKMDSIEVQIHPDAADSLKIHSVTISRNTIGSCSYGMLRIFGLLLVLNIIIAGVYLWKYLRQQAAVLLGLLFLFAISSLWIYGRGMPMRDDTLFQWARVWELANGIKNGDFPVRIQPGWANGYGYAVSVFYGDLFLYFPALLVLLKIPLSIACKIYLLTINFGTILLSYITFRKIGKQRTIGLLCSAVYTLSSYRMCNVYYRGAVGEYTAMMLLPVVVLGLWNIIFENTEEQDYRKQWMILSLGMTGIIMTHVLSCEMMTVFLILLCIIAARRVFEKVRFIELCKAVIGTVGLSVAFLIPFLDYSREELNVFQQRTNYAIQEYGISLQQIIGLGEPGMRQSQSEAVSAMAISVGIAAILTIVAALYCVIKDQGSRKKCRIAGALFLAVFACFMATDIFPYDKMEQVPVLKLLIGSLQFPFRFMSIATILLTMLLCLVAMEMQGKLKKNFYLTFQILLCVLVLVQNVQYGDYIRTVKTQVMNKADGAEWTEAPLTMYGGQYLYQGTDYYAVMDDDKIGGWVEIEDYKRRGLEFEITCSSAIDTRMELPLFYYPDYRCWDINTKQQFRTVKGDNNELWVDNIPAGYNGTLKVAFVEPLLWRIAEVISLCTIGVYALLIYRDYKKEKQRRFAEKGNT